jgi:hypothetical protein
MSRIVRLIVLFAGLAALLVLAPTPSDAQGRGGVRRAPSPPVIHRTVPVPVVRGQVVFIGGYFYDPFYGPYPWWPRTAYPYWYFPVYSTRAEVRLLMEPEEAEDAAVYVDGFYAGTVDDFNGVFQALPLPPGGHEITIYLEGYRTLRWNAYLRPGTTLKLRETLVRLPVGEISEMPTLAPPVPAPPAGTFTPPITPPQTRLTTKAAVPPEAVGFGTIVLRVRPIDATVTIDGERWVSSDDGRFAIQVAVGTHRVDVSAAGRERFSTEAQVREGETTALDVMLSETR